MNSGLSGPATRVGTTIVCHSMVDFFSFFLIPLIPLLKTTLSLTTAQIALLLAVGSVTSGVIQPAVAWVSDRFDTRAPGVLGMATAVLCISFAGRSESYAVLLTLWAVGAAGIGAFHPVAAAAVGQLAGSKRSLIVALFFAAGMLGGMIGNVASPFIVGQLTLPGTVWMIPVGMVGVVALGFALRGVPHRHVGALDEHRGLTLEEQRRRWQAVGILYVGNVLRFTTNMCLIFLFAELVEDMTLLGAGEAELTDSLAQTASERNGPVQAAMQVGMGGFGLLAGALLRSHHEKASLVLMPIVGSVLILMIPRIDQIADAIGTTAVVPALTVGLAGLCGVAFGGLIPITISLAQRLLVHRTSLASGLMMGGAWAVAGFGPIAAERIQQSFGLDWAFVLPAGLLLLAGLLAIALPGDLVRNAGVKAVSAD